MDAQRDQEKVWVDVPGFNSGEMASSVHGSQARILQSVNADLTYDQLICYGAFAFRVSVHNEMCPSAGHPCCGFMCIENANRAIPWRMKTFDAFPWDKKTEPDRAAFEAETCAGIKASIDRGVPVHYGSEEDGLIIGYADDGRRWLCLHPYHKNGTEQFWHDEVEGFAGGEWPWGIAVWTEPKAAPERTPRRQLTIAALRQAIKMWDTGKREDYWVGDAAYTHWLTWLSDVEAGRLEDPKAGMQGNGWCFDVLIHCRRIAARWLKAEAEEFAGDTKQHLLTAAAHYSHMVERLGAGLKCPWDLALPPNRYDDWTSAMRLDQIGRLEAARQQDRAAVMAIKQAMQTM